MFDLVGPFAAFVIFSHKIVNIILVQYCNFLDWYAGETMVAAYYENHGATAKHTKV